MQSLGMAHRDIKPSNIFISRKRTLKVGDFGGSREQEDFKLGENC